MPAPRLPPLLEDQLAFPTAVGGDHARMLGRYGPDGVPVFVKQWRPGAGPELDTRMQWQAAAARALGDGCPPVLQRLRWSGASVSPQGSGRQNASLLSVMVSMMDSLLATIS